MEIETSGDAFTHSVKVWMACACPEQLKGRGYRWTMSFAPVCVKTADGVRLIGSARAVLRFLYKWPSERRGPAFGSEVPTPQSLVSFLSINHMSAHSFDVPYLRAESAHRALLRVRDFSFPT